MQNLPAQQYLFNHIREALPQNISLVDTVASLLSVSNDSAYRRIRGETALTLDETIILCNRFNISMDQLLQAESNSILFQDKRINGELTFDKFLKNLQDLLTSLKQFKEHEIIYLTKDIPLFQMFCFKSFFAFRYFFWMKSIIQHPDFKNKLFSVECLPKQIEEIGFNIVKLYNSFPSIEIWNTECINSIIFQIEYYKEVGFFSNPADIELLYDSVIAALDHLEAEAEAGAKFLPKENPEYKKSNFHLYYNRIVLADNTVYTRVGNRQYVYLNYDVLNYMQTSNERFCNEIYEMMQNLIRRSALISSQNEGLRYKFFNEVRQKLLYNKNKK